MSDSTGATATPAPVEVPPTVDTAAVRELLGAMKVTLGNLDQTFRTLNEQSAQVSSLGPTMEMAVTQLSSLRHQIRNQEKEQDIRVNEIRRMIKEEIKVKAADEMGQQIRETIRQEITKQAKEQISLQTNEVLPVPLHKQTEESRRHLEQVKNALANSEARRKNSVLRPSPNNLNDELALVLRPDGQKSKLYPANLHSLFAYDYNKSKALVKDFGLHEHGVLEKNLNGFMAHIGIQFELVPVPSSEATQTGSSVLMPMSASK
ncbi:hypothetical protein BD309DRAFT_925479 [Dichomitus squalens]|nr:hypothetical protein BD309DRAFT_925479 [Dichomitus squalens]